MVLFTAIDNKYTVRLHGVSFFPVQKILLREQRLRLIFNPLMLGVHVYCLLWFYFAILFTHSFASTYSVSSLKKEKKKQLALDSGRLPFVRSVLFLSADTSHVH